MEDDEDEDDDPDGSGLRMLCFAAGGVLWPWQALQNMDMYGHSLCMGQDSVITPQQSDKIQMVSQMARHL